MYSMNTKAEENLGESLVVCQILTMSRDKNKESKQAVIQTFTLYSIAKAELCIMSLHGKSFSKNFKF